MQSTGHTSTHPRSLTPIQGSAITYVTVNYDGVGYLIGDVLWSDRTEKAVKDRAIAFLETHFQG